MKTLLPPEEEGLQLRGFTHPPLFPMTAGLVGVVRIKLIYLSGFLFKPQANIVTYVGGQTTTPTTHYVLFHRIPPLSPLDHSTQVGFSVEIRQITVA